MKKAFLSIFVSLLLLTLVSCGQEVSYEPREINPDIDVCEVCNMSIVHTDFATQLVEKDGTTHIYDDIGCMFEFLQGEGKDIEIAAKYVRDMETLEWVPLEEAYYVYDQSFWTPMAFGVLSFATKERAEHFIEEQGKGELMTYQDLQSFDWGF